MNRPDDNIPGTRVTYAEAELFPGLKRWFNKPVQITWLRRLETRILDVMSAIGQALSTPVYIPRRMTQVMPPKKAHEFLNDVKMRPNDYLWEINSYPITGRFIDNQHWTLGTSSHKGVVDVIFKATNWTAQ